MPWSSPGRSRRRRSWPRWPSGRRHPRPGPGIAEVPCDRVYRAMDWLLGRQDAIEAELARRHLRPGGIAMFDLSSSWVEGTHCGQVARGYSRDGKKGRAQVGPDPGGGDHAPVPDHDQVVQPELVPDHLDGRGERRRVGGVPLEDPDCDRAAVGSVSSPYSGLPRRTAWYMYRGRRR